jgi:hypothetical protein
MFDYKESKKFWNTEREMQLEQGQTVDETELNEAIVGKIDSVREKYQIPENVYLFLDHEYSGVGMFPPSEVFEVMPYVKAFVRGELEDESIDELWFYFEECEECDWIWAFLGEPAGYYDKESTWKSSSEYIDEMKRIGCRSKNKNHKLRKLSDFFLSK